MIDPLLLFVFALPTISFLFLAAFGRRVLAYFRASSAFVPLVLAYFIPLVLLSWGVFMRYTGPTDTEPRWLLGVLAGLDIGFLLFLIYVVWRSSGFRLLVSTLLLPVILLGLWAQMFATIFLTND